MAKYPALIFAVLLSFSNCFADTFTNRQTGKSFNGYFTQMKKGNKTKVFTEGKKPQYLDLNDYEIQYNHLGRKNKVFVFSIKNPIDLICETDAFEKAIVSVTNQGPLFILIEMDIPTGRFDLARRISEAIIKIDNCRTVAFISGGQANGVFSTGAVVPLACDKIYMHQDTAIGAAAGDIETSYEEDTIKKSYNQAIDPESRFHWQEYASEVAKLNNRPVLLVNAMVDKNIEIVEVAEDGKPLLIDRRKRKRTQSIVRTWSEKDALLTLTADEAVKYGIADNVVASRQQLLENLEAAEAKLISDKSILKTRREFEQAQRKLDRILDSVNSLIDRADTVAGEINTVEADISRVSKVTALGQENIKRGYYRYPKQERELKKLAEDRDRLSARLVIIFNDTIRNYNQALDIVNRHPDLGNYVAALEKNLETTRAEFDAKSTEVRFRPRRQTRSR